MKDLPRLGCVATLHCEMLLSESKRLSETDVVINGKSTGGMLHVCDTHLMRGGIFTLLHIYCGILAYIWGEQPCNGPLSAEAAVGSTQCASLYRRW